jgi:hypothetical protein
MIFLSQNPDASYSNRNVKELHQLPPRIYVYSSEQTAHTVSSPSGEQLEHKIPVKARKYFHDAGFISSRQHY